MRPCQADWIGQAADHVIYYSIMLAMNFIHFVIVIFYEKSIE